MNFSKLENLFKLECAWLENFILRKNKFEKDQELYFPFKINFQRF